LDLGFIHSQKTALMNTGKMPALPAFSCFAESLFAM